MTIQGVGMQEELSAAGQKRVPERFNFGYLIHALARDRETLINHYMKPLGITRAQGVVLGILAREGNRGIMQADLARLLEIGKVSAGGLIDRLEATGLVERRADGADRRVKQIFITSLGYSKFEQVVGVSSRWNRLILEGITPEEQEITEKVLARVKGNIRTFIDDRDMS